MPENSVPAPQLGLLVISQVVYNTIWKMLAFKYYSFNHLEWYILRAGRIKRVWKHGLHLKKWFSENKWIIFIKCIEPCCVLHWKIFVLVNPFRTVPYGETSISASTKPFGIWISSVHRRLIWVYWNEENIRSALSEGALLFLLSGSTCSASSDYTITSLVWFYLRSWRYKYAA